MSEIPFILANSDRRPITHKTVTKLFLVFIAATAKLASAAADGPCESSSTDNRGVLDFDVFHTSRKPGDLIFVELRNGRGLYLEVTKANTSTDGLQPILEVLCEGESIHIGDDPPFTPSHKGHWPRLSDAWVKRLPALHAALRQVRQAQIDSGSLPSRALTTHGIASAHYVGSLASLETEVSENPSFWCDGTGPGDATPTALQTALLSAGELIAFLNGNRGVCLIQIDLPSTSESGRTLPLMRPFVLKLLQRAAQTKGALILASTLSGGLAASLVLASKKQPFKARGEYIAKMGIQASLVADSPFYKLLVGRILGYTEKNVLHHITVGWESKYFWKNRPNLSFLRVFRFCFFLRIPEN